MYLWQLTLVGPTTVTAVASGSFTAAKRHELVVATPSALLLLRSTPDGRLRCLSACPAYGAVRAVAPVRLPGSRRDVLAVTADSGRLALLLLSATTSPPSWTPLHVETYGKSGVRRLVPGQYLVVDPRGRALLVAAVERQKFAVVLNQDAEAALTVASPLAAHKSRTATLGVVAADVGWENPVFVALERPYEPRGGPVGLVAYELDLGLNTVVRRALGGESTPPPLRLWPYPEGTTGRGGCSSLPTPTCRTCHFGWEGGRWRMPPRPRREEPPQTQLGGRLRPVPSGCGCSTGGARRWARPWSPPRRVTAKNGSSFSSSARSAGTCSSPRLPPCPLRVVRVAPPPALLPPPQARPRW